jgi:hypothetical protein
LRSLHLGSAYRRIHTCITHTPCLALPRLPSPRLTSPSPAPSPRTKTTRLLEASPARPPPPSTLPVSLPCIASPSSWPAVSPGPPDPVPVSIAIKHPGTPSLSVQTNSSAATYQTRPFSFFSFCLPISFSLSCGSWSWVYCTSALSFSSLFSVLGLVPCHPSPPLLPWGLPFASETGYPVASRLAPIPSNLAIQSPPSKPTTRLQSKWRNQRPQLCLRLVASSARAYRQHSRRRNPDLDP